LVDKTREMAQYRLREDLRDVYRSNRYGFMLPLRAAADVKPGGAMKRLARLLISTAVVSVGVTVPVSSAFATTPPGLQGYEGQPGNQGGHGGQPPGLQGYEGQPGNQGGHGGQPPGLLGYEGQPGNQGG
jgi:hypothetical protein